MITGTEENIPDNTPIIVGAGQYTEHIDPGSEPPLHSPAELATRACFAALKDSSGSVSAADIDTIAFIRLFSDSAPAWACPFGGSNNLPESVAQQIGASPRRRIYSNLGGTQPLQLMAELLTGIARGEINCALLTGSEAIANQRYAQRQGITLDWAEEFDAPLDSRLYTERFASPQEIASGMFLPVHYYALIENYRAHQQGNNTQEHIQQMAELFSSFSAVAASNPYAFFHDQQSTEDLCSQSNGNYPISLPYSKKLIAQDAVNQAAALLLTSVGQAKAWGIDPSQWIFLQGYAEGEDQCVSQRLDIGKSQSLDEVIGTALATANAQPESMDLVDIYSCFPCAVEAVCNTLGYPIDGSRPLTITGGLPYFGGPGNNYSMHALAEMASRIKDTGKRGLVTANGGQLSKHAAAILANAPAGEGEKPLDLADHGPEILNAENIPTSRYCDSPEAGNVLSYTVIYLRNTDDLAVVLAENENGERFFARSADPEVTQSVNKSSPIGRAIEVTSEDGKHLFSFSAEQG